MSDNSTQQPAPLLRDNGVPLVPRRGPHRPLAPSQALTQMQEQRVNALVAKATKELRARVERLEEMLAALTQAPASKKETPVPEVEPQQKKPEAIPSAASAPPAAPAAKAIPLPTANAEISDAAHKIIDRAKNPDLKRALIATAKKDVPEEVKLKQMETALKKHEPTS